MDGKVAVVSGASSGSGVGITRRFVQEGATVVMLARARQRLEEVAAEFGPSAVPIATDVGDPGSVRHAFDEVAERFGKLNVLVNHAAVYRPCAVELLDDEDITRQMATNFFGPVYTSRAAVPLLRAAGGGDIVNTSSESTLHPFPMLSMYVASKAALEAFGKVLAQEVPRRHPGDDGRAGHRGRRRWRRHGLAWDPERSAAAHALWTERGLLDEVLGRYSGQTVDDIGDVHVFIVDPPPRTAARHGARAEFLRVSSRRSAPPRRPAPKPSSAAPGSGRRAPSALSAGLAWRRCGTGGRLSGSRAGQAATCSARAPRARPADSALGARRPLPGAAELGLGAGRRGGADRRELTLRSFRTCTVSSRCSRGRVAMKTCTSPMSSTVVQYNDPSTSLRSPRSVQSA